MALSFELLMTRSAVINWVGGGGSIGVIDHARTVVAEADFFLNDNPPEKDLNINNEKKGIYNLS